MPDTFQWVDTQDSRGSLKMRLHDLGDGTFSKGAVAEGHTAEELVVTQFSNTSLSSLVTAVNDYLQNTATNRVLSVTTYAGGITTLTHYTVIVEKVNV